MKTPPHHPLLNWPTRPCDPPESIAIPRLQEIEFVPAVQARIKDLSQAPITVNPSNVTNRLCHGDNLDIMHALIPELERQIDLIYIDPPFCTGVDFKVHSAAGESVPGAKLEPAFCDSWTGGLNGYLDMIYPRLKTMYALLKDTGSMYLHVDPTVSHYLKVLMDEVFGAASFQREIIWRIGWVSGFKSSARNWIRNHDVILYYVKTPGLFTFNKELLPHPEGYSRRKSSRNNAHKPILESSGRPIDDVWNASLSERELKGSASLDSIQIKSFSKEKTGYATQKNESLIERILRASSNPGDLVADFFCGSGTTPVVAERLGRQWIACDIGDAAIRLSIERLKPMESRQAFRVIRTTD